MGTNKLVYSVFVIVFLLLSGCYNVKIRINVNADGSGTVEETFLIANLMQEMGMAQDNRDDEHNRADLEAAYSQETLEANGRNYGEDLRLIEREILTENRMSGYRAVYEFEDINRIRIDENFSSKLDLNTGMMGTLSDQAVRYIKFDHKKGSTSKLRIIFPPDPEPSEQEQAEIDKIEEMDEDEYEMMKVFFADMYFNLSVGINGKITKTDAKFREGSTITLIDLDFSKMMENDEAFKQLVNEKNMDPHAMDKLLKNNFKEVKYELKDTVEIEFK